MRGRLRNPLLVCACALALAACGGGDDGTIPPDEANDLLALLAAVEKYADEGNCELAQQNAAELITRVNTLPEAVDSKVARELTAASDHLRQLAADPGQCTGASGEAGVEPTDTSEIETTPTDTTEAETTVTETTAPEEETTTEEAPEEDQEEPAGGQDQGGGEQGGGDTPPAGGTPSPSPSGGLEPPAGGDN